MFTVSGSNLHTFKMMGTSPLEHNRRQTHGGGRSNGPYADSLPLYSQPEGGAGRGAGGLGLGGVWGRLKGIGAPGPQHIRLKMTPSSR